MQFERIDYHREHGSERRETMMLMTPGRIGYLGRIGTHDKRVLGATTIYVARERPFTIWRKGIAEEAMVALVPAHEVHRVSSPEAYGAQLIIESETIDDPVFADRMTLAEQRMCAQKILAGFEWVESDDGDAAFDRIFFGRTLSPRHLDRRVRVVARRVCADPAGRHSAEIYAHDVGLSVSRFSHLFRAEIGSTFRRYCAWKRVRGIMPLFKHEESLVQMALAAGYADSTHFSHSVRQFFGVRPRDIVDIMAPQRFKMIVAARAEARRIPLAA